MSDYKMMPLGDRLLVEPIDVTADPNSLIVIPKKAKQTPNVGIVRALGSGLRGSKRVPFEVQSGDKVVYYRHAGTLIRGIPTNYKLLDRGDVIAVFTEPEPPLKLVEA